MFIINFHKYKKHAHLIFLVIIINWNITSVARVLANERLGRSAPLPPPRSGLTSPPIWSSGRFHYIFNDKNSLASLISPGKLQNISLFLEA